MTNQDTSEAVPGLISDDRSIVDQMIVEGDSSELVRIPIFISMHEDNYDWALSVCIRLAAHTDPIVRGNAVLGFGHLARRFRQMSQSVVPTVQAALADDHPHVSGHAHSACEDISLFTDWGIEGFELGSKNRKSYPKEPKC